MEKNAKKLLEKYLSGNCTPDERAIVEQWYLQIQAKENSPSFSSIEDSKAEVWSRLRLAKSTSVMSFLKITAVAASILICVAVGSYFLQPSKSLNAKRELKEILPGSNRALLTLADGTVVDLQDAKNGQIASQNGIIIRKNKNGELEYIIQDNPSGSNGTNIISTPRGGQYQVSLPDGTKVWLNAASSLKYPSTFTGNERAVELNGEAYFEVAKDQSHPFRVKANGQTVEVLGTHFNINSYADESLVKTTLLEGAVKVSSVSSTVSLHPGEQAQFSGVNSKISVDKQIDVEKEIAWKNDVFSFDNDDLKSIMRQISRWYDVDILYKGKIPDEKYIGEIPRNSNLSEVFKILELNHIHTEINGKMLTISGN